MKSNHNLEFLIFDMGNVIIDIDISLTIRELKNELTEKEFFLADEFLKSAFHADFETGAIDEMEFRNGDESFTSLFDGIFLSYEMGLKKPDKKIYEKAMAEIGAKPGQCLFFDDLEENLTAAKEVGLETHHINHPKALMDYFSHVQ
jgi:putative hydrolase of the HAD superfamily